MAAGCVDTNITAKFGNFYCNTLYDTVNIDAARFDDIASAFHKLGMPSAAESLSTARRIAFHQSS